MKFLRHFNLSIHISSYLLAAAFFAAASQPAAAQAPGSDFYYVTAAELGAAVPAALIPYPAEAVRGSSQGGYLSPVELQFPGFPAAPAAGSAADAADMAAVLQWQKDRTDAQCAAAKAQSDESFAAFFGNVSPFPAPLPAGAAAFFRKVSADAGDASRGIKNVYKRPRPFQASAAVNPCLGKIQGFSYPSGHATTARVFGLCLSSLLPRQGAIFMRNADEAALNRVIGGVHYPVDVEAGKQLGDLLFKALQRNPAFAADLNALSKYLKR